MKNLRLEKFRNLMKNEKIECALIYSDANRNYLTGFTGDESYAVITQDKAIFITDSRYTEQAESQVVDFEVRKFQNKLTDYLKDLIKSFGAANLGFEENFMTFDMYEGLKSGLENVEFLKLNSMVEKLRQVKDDGEIECIKRAAAIADEAFSHIIGFIKPGMSENQVGLELEFFMRKKGASRLSFTSIVASGKRSSLPHGTATDKVIENGDFLTLDFGCVYRGYCSDMTRTVVIGSADERQKEIYNIVLEANERALEEVKPGITGEELDRIARNVISERGFGEYFGHGLGHGVGMQIHELPYVSKKGKDQVQAGMVITDEPGIYIPSYGGVRIEDLVLVTGQGYEVLSKSNKQLIEIGN